MFQSFFAESVRFGFNSVLDDARINPELGVTIVIGMGRFRRALSAGWFNRYFTIRKWYPNRIHHLDDERRGPSYGTGIGREVVPKPRRNSSTVSTLTPLKPTPIRRPSL